MSNRDDEVEDTQDRDATQDTQITESGHTALSFGNTDTPQASLPASRPIIRSSSPVRFQSQLSSGGHGGLLVSQAPSSAVRSDQPLPTSPGGQRTRGLGSTGSHQLQSTPRQKRSDIRPTGAMERFLALSSEVGTQLQQQDTQMTDPGQTTRFIWGTTVNIQNSIAMFRDFILNFTLAHLLSDMDQLLGIGDDEPFYHRLLTQLRDAQIFSMNLDAKKLFAYQPARRLYYQLIRYPQEIVPLMDHGLTEIFLEKFPDAQMPVGGSMRVRPFNLPDAANLRDLNPADIDQLITVKGLLIRASPVIPDMKMAFFRCSVCDCSVEVESDRGRVNEPTLCPHTQCQMKNTMRLVHNRSIFSDKQICRIQETPDQTPDGQTPYTVSMCVYDEMVDVMKPGDRVEITGIFRGVPVRNNPRFRAFNALFKTYVDVVHIKRSNTSRIGMEGTIDAENEFHVDFNESDDIHRPSFKPNSDLLLGSQLSATDQQEEELDADVLRLAQCPDLYDALARSVAPSIFGMEDVKKGVLLQLFGGTSKFNGNKPGSPRIRGDINILLVGDPGVSKSQLLQYVHKIAPRGVYTSGKGSSAVGLTAYVTRDPETRQLVLESGALVLSDGGVCCIDEFDKMSDHTRSVLHEVMEQQTISVAKAGIITTLNARTSILACANPINSKFDMKLSVPQNVNLPPPLMSRFDLLYLILDKPNERDDRRLAQHLVGLYLEERPEAVDRDFVPIQLLTRYINHAKKNVKPVISDEAAEALSNFYVSMRKAGSQGGANVITFTTRQLESMIRLSEAHAKMRLSAVVERRDVEEANRLVLTALQTAAVDPRTGRIDMDLVTTGISAYGRMAHETKRSAVRELVRQLEKQSVPWSEVYRLMQGQSDQFIPETEFNSILGDLVDEGTVHVTGRSNADKIIRKLK